MTSIVALGCDDNEGVGSTTNNRPAAVETAPSYVVHHLPVTKSSKPSILRNPIQRLRRRRQSEKHISNKIGDGVERLSPILPMDRQEGVFEEGKTESAEVLLFRRDRERSGAIGAPFLEIAGEDHHEAIFYHPSVLQPSPPQQQNLYSGDDERYSSTQSGSGTNVEADMPSHLVLPHQHKHKPAGRSIMKSSFSNDRNVVRQGKFRRTGRKIVSFDESTIVQRQEKNGILGNISLAMPVILPYLIAVLILILSSLIPPDPAVTGRIVNSKNQHRPPSLPAASLTGSQTFSPKAIPLLKSSAPHVTTTRSENPQDDLKKTSTKSLASDESRQVQVEGPAYDLTCSQPHEAKPLPGQEFNKMDVKSKTKPTKNPFVRVWRAVRRIGKAPSP